MRLKELNEKALKWLAEVGETRYKNANDKDAYAHRYTVGRYKIGLEHYAKLFDHIGLTGRGPGLDVGSGSGHWVNAYAALNERGEGVELREEFVELANGVTEAIGMADRSKHLVGDAKALPYEPESFDAVWSHGVMMFVEHDRMLFEMNRVLRDKNHIYLAYTALGSRVFTLSQPGQEPAALRLRAVAAQTIFNAKLYELGVYLTPNGRTRAYTREQLQYAAQYCGFTTVSTPGLQDAARRWHGVESTIDMVAKKQSDVFRHLETIVRAAGGTDGVIAEAEKATRTGAPESAIGMLDIAGIGMDDAPGRRANIAARMKAGRIQRYVDPALDNLETDETDAGRILHATAAVNFSNWKEAQKRLDKAPRTQDMEFLRLAMLIGSKKPVEALAQAEKLAEAAPRDIYMRVGLIRALMDANDPDRLYAETRQFVQDVEDDKIDISKI